MSETFRFSGEDWAVIHEVIGSLEEHKIYAEDMAKLAALSHFSADRAAKLMQCGTYVGMQPRIDDPGAWHIVESNFCRQRLCPMCAWRKSLKMYSEIQDVVQALPGYEYILCTLTVPNVALDELSGALDRIYRQFRCMMKRPEVRAWEGWIRSTEVSYNRDTNTLHPHLHVLVAVRPQYFSGRAYVSQRKLQQLWQIGQQVDLRKIKDLRRGVCEAVKYATKPLELPVDPRLAERNAEVYDALRIGLHGRRLIQTGGVIRDVLKELRIDLEADDQEGRAVDDLPLLALSWDNLKRKYSPNENSRLGR